VKRVALSIACLEGGTSMNSGLFLLLIGGLLIVLVLVLFLPTKRSQTKADIPADRQLTGAYFRDDDRYWYAGIFYNNPDDPAVFVPKRYGQGWTVNFGHPTGKRFMILLMIGIILLLLLPVILGIFFPGFSSYGCHPSGCHPLP
jgi:uncharacterized membrane protein